MIAKLGKWFSLPLLCLFSVCVGCGPIVHKMGSTSSLTDPFFKIGSDQTIGLLSRNSLSDQLDPLLERTLLADCKIELEKRGFRVQLIDGEQIEHEGDQWSFRDPDEAPELLLMLHSEVENWQETVPEQGSSSSRFSTGSSYGSGGSSSNYVGEHEITRTASGLIVSILSGPPEYETEVWRGESIIEGNMIVDHHAVLVQTLFLNEFPVGLVNQPE